MATKERQGLGAWVLVLWVLSSTNNHKPLGNSDRPQPLSVLLCPARPLLWCRRTSVGIPIHKPSYSTDSEKTYL